MTDPTLPDFLDAGKDRLPRRRLRRLALVLLPLAVAGAVLLPGGGTQTGRYLTEEAVVGDLTVSIAASGALQPTRSVDVGSELSGTLAEVMVRENDRVAKGQVLARLDTSKLHDAVVKSRAALAQTEATLAEARATLERLRRVAELSGGKLPSQAELEAARAALQRAAANEASARAALKSDETNLVKAAIRSPIGGVVLARKVEPGQTVVAAMTTPVLFTIAEDLARMELQAKVDEADIGSVRPGQPASFTVAAWPGRSFPAHVERVGLGASVTDNVVTYKTLLSVANDDLALRPGMTATARIVTAKRDRVLLVPTAALRFKPPEGAGASAGIVSRLVPRAPLQKSRQRPTPQSGAGQIWLLRDGAPVAVPVRIGQGNGRQTEIAGGDLKAGMPVIVEYQEAAK